MDTTLPLPFLPSVDLGKGATESENGLTRKQLSYLGCVHFAATSQNVDTLLQFLQRHVSIEAYVDVTEIESAEDIVTILDAGARNVFVKPSQLNALSRFEERVVPVIEAQGAFSAAKYPNGVYLTPGSAKHILGNLKDAKVSPIFLATSAEDLESTVKLAAEHSAIPIIPATNLVVGTSSKGQFSVDVLIESSWTSDRSDKLIPTVVTDERGIALGLVYSSRESLAESIKTGTGVYQSRKRGLWYKGATSGDTQELVRISLDCDQDCLKFVVRQNGRGMYMFCGYKNFANLHRILSLAPVNLFWGTSWACKTRENSGFQKDIRPGRIIHGTLIFRRQTTPSEDNGRGRGAM